MIDKMSLANTLDWQKLRGFYYVAKLGSFTKAGENVFRTQSALSQQIKSLESNLGFTLLQRVGKQNITLTREGQILLEFIEEILDRQIGLFEDLKTIQNKDKGQVRIGAAPTMVYGVLPSLLANFKMMYPDITVSVYTRTPDEIIEMLKNGFLDLGITFESVIPQNFIKYKWHINRFWLMTPPAHYLTKTHKLTLEEIFSYPIIVTPNNSFLTRKKFEMEAERLGITLDIVLESSCAFASAEYVKKGLGICCMAMPDEVIRSLSDSLSFIALDDFFAPEYVVLYHREAKISSSAQTFLHTALHQFAK